MKPAHAHINRDDLDSGGFWDASWAEAARKYHIARGKSISTVIYAPDELARLRALDSVSLERLYAEARQQRADAPEATVEAVVYTLRECGAEALQCVSTRERLAVLSERQIEAVITRLARTRDSKITEEFVLLLAELLP